jgi:uncharacterized SAM-binding protein YcdF (DUF218 family)
LFRIHTLQITVSLPLHESKKGYPGKSIMNPSSTPQSLPYDAIIVLGGGLNPNNTLPLTAQLRVKHAIGLYQQNVAPIVVMSGRWSMLATTPYITTEAETMRQYAIRNAVIPPDAILAESNSMDTLGNAYYTCINFAQPKNWQRILVVTSDWHVKRSQYLFNLVMADSCAVEISAVPSKLSASEIAAKTALEDQIMAFYKQKLDNVVPGDLNIVKAVLDLFPGYNPFPFYTRDTLMRQFNLDSYDTHEPPTRRP